MLIAYDEESVIKHVLTVDKSRQFRHFC